MERTCKHAATAALRAYREIHGTDTAEADGIDLITDLLLLLQEQGEDTAAIRRMVANHFEEEDSQDEDPEDDGQPSEWEEWQDLHGGDEMFSPYGEE